jgi:hypothetical protein
MLVTWTRHAGGATEAPGSGHVDQYGARAANPSLAGVTAAHFAHGTVLLPTIRPVL